MNLNLPLILQKYDKGNQLIFIREFTGELSNRNIHLNRDDISFLLAEVKPNSLNQINYIEMANFIMNNDRSSPSPFNPNTQFKNTQNISMNNQNYNINNQFNNPSMQHQNQGVFITVKEKIKAIYQSQGISLKALFRQIDLDNDNFISYKEFSDCLERKIDMHNLPPNLIDECFKQFDDDRDYKISYFEFSKHILNLDSIDHKKLLLKLKNQLLQKTSGEKDLLKLFKSMDKDNNGDLSFLEFTEALKNFNLSFTKNEIEDIFRYFDKGDKEKISYDHFVEVLSEDHLNLSPLREKIKNVIKEKGLSIKAYFRSLNSKGEDDFLNKKEFSDFLKKLGFKYDIEQEEELFETFDQDKDYLISYDEFNDLILENKQQDISSILKRLRQLVFSQKRDLLPEFEYLDSYREGLLSFQDFSKVLKKFSELSPFEIDCLFKGFIAVGSQKINYCEFWDCLLKIDCDIEPIKKKFDELCSRWNVDYEGLFNQFDQSGKGYLSPLDFDQMLLALHIRLPIEEVQEYFNAFDINKNGMLSQREFIEVLIGKKDKNKMMFLNVKSPVWKRSSDTYNTNQEFKFNEEFRGRKPLALNLKPSEWDEESSQHKFGNPPNRQTFGDSDGESSNFSPYKKEKNKGMNPVKSLFNKEEEEEHLEPKELVEIMKKQAYIKRLTLFSLFLEFDHNKTCVLTNIHDLETLIKYRLDLRQLSYSNIEVLFNYYSPDNGKTMNFIRLLMDIEDQSTVLIEMMKYVMKIQNVELADVFQNIDKDLDNVWDIKEFSSLNVLLNVGMERNEINKIFKQWDLNGNGLISILELEKIFNINSEGRINNKSQGINQKNNNFDSNQKNMNMNFNSKQKKMGEDFDQNQLYQKFKRLKDYIRYIYQIFQEKGILSNIYALFETNEPEMPRMKFLKDLMKLKINVERQEGNELASLLVSEKNFSFINLREFECLLKNFPYIFQEEESNKKTQSPNQKPLTNDINLIVQELKSIIEEEGFQLVSQYERNNSGFISEMDLNTALTKVLDPCEELNIFIKYVSQNGKVSLEELKKIFEVNERQKGQFTANSLGVKTNYKSSKIMNNNEKRIVKEDFKELQRAFGLYYPGY